jgi:hypothetical protein
MRGFAAGKIIGAPTIGLFGFNCEEVSRALIGYSNEIGTYGKDRDAFTERIRKAQLLSPRLTFSSHLTARDSSQVQAQVRRSGRLHLLATRLTMRLFFGNGTGHPIVQATDLKRYLPRDRSNNDLMFPYPDRSLRLLTERCQEHRLKGVP